MKQEATTMVCDVCGAEAPQPGLRMAGPDGKELSELAVLIACANCDPRERRGTVKFAQHRGNNWQQLALYCCAWLAIISIVGVMVGVAAFVVRWGLGWL